MGALEKELTVGGKKLAECTTQEGECWAYKKTEIFQIAKFYNLLGAKSASFLEKELKGVIAQLKEAGYPPEDVALDFQDIQKVLNDIRDEDID